MCEIQFIKRLDNKFLDSEDIFFFEVMMIKGSFWNKDAWGLFNNSILTKKEGSFKSIGLLNYELLKNNFVVGHNRLATNGNANKNENNHPFESKNFILVHNGIISNYAELTLNENLYFKGETDSLVILHLIEKYYQKTNDISKAIKKTTKKLIGSYSVFVLDKNTNTLYYFKSENAKFSFCYIETETKKILLGSTNVTNFNNLYCDREQIFYIPKYKKHATMNAKSKVIYQITSEIKEIGKFKECEITKEITSTIEYTNCLIEEFFNNYFNGEMFYRKIGNKIYLDDMCDLTPIEHIIEPHFDTMGTYILEQDILFLYS
ncbi:MAG: class II glutamine amidotransferase [Candidatus Pacearchaeota archaeon]|jgi:predicted glutamine amidotransferase